MSSQRIGTLIGIAFVAVLLLACGSSNSGARITATAPAAGSGGSSGGEVATAAPAGEAATAAPAPTDAPAVIGKVGERVEAGDTAMTLIALERKEELSQFQKADAGEVYVVAEVSIEALADKTPYNLFYFKAKDSEGFEYNAEIGAEQALQSGELAKGEKARGFVAFKVKAATTGLVMNYKPLTFSDRTPIRFSLDQ